MVFFRVQPLLESDPAQRTPARQQTPAAEAIAWLEDPQPPPPPESLQEQVIREIAQAIGWHIEEMQEAVRELHSYPGDKPK